MAAAHTATVAEDGDDTIVRFSGKVRLPAGPVLVREDEVTGEVILAPVPPVQEPNPWIDFFDAMDRIPRDEHWNAFIQVMEERPMNRPPMARNLFADEDQ